jgi:hypothetical protein
MKNDERIAVVEKPYDVTERESPFGQRWRDEIVTLTYNHLEALKSGKSLALDVQGEYEVFLRLDKGAQTVEQKEVQHD